MKPSKQTTLVIALATLGVVSVGALHAQTAPAKVEKIEVTGSNIKRIDAETASPVQVITREDIEKTGKLTIGEVLRDIPSNSGNSFNETFTNSFSPGSSGVALRGLGQKATLVLINGRRTASYGFAQNLQDTFVDLNSIPNSAIDRVEILKDGASAIYGSDAIAGVINIILRKDFKGLELSASGGTRYEAGMNELRASITGGIGDLAKDRYNVLAVADYYHRDLLTWSETSWLRDGDNRSFNGGALNGWSSGVGTIQGPVIAGFGSRIALNPCPAGSVQRPIGDFDGRRQGTVCARNVADFLTLFPKSDRVGLLARGTIDFTANLSGFAEGNYSKNKSFQKFTAAFAPTSQVDQSTGLTVTTNIILPVGHPNNPTTAARILQYAFYELGGRDSDITSESSRALAGLKGNIGKWDWEAAIGGAKSETTQVNYNRVNRFLLTPAFVASYNFSTPNQAAANTLRITPQRVATSKLTFADVKASTELFTLPAGPVGFAAGLEYRRESLADRPDALITSGAVLGQGGTATDGSRNSNAIYGELSIPILKSLEAQLAARRDKYSDFGGRTSPKIGLKWTVTKDFIVRATNSRGFKAPTLPEVSPSLATFFTTVFDPDPNVQNFVSIAGTVKSNPNIKPETSKAQTVGFVWEPSKDFSFSVDYYNIKLENTIQAPIQADFNQAARGNAVAASHITRDANGIPLAWSGQYINLDFQETDGFDFEARYGFNALGGKVSLAAAYTYIKSYRVPIEPGGAATDVVDLNGGDFTSSLPRYKGNISGTFEKGDWATTLTYRYVHSTDQVNAGTPLRAGATAPDARVGAYYDMDLFVAYTGIKNLRLTGAVRNLINKRPPYDPAYGSGIDFTQYDARGRFYTVGATYSFK